ncbi:MAG: isochorismatase family protein [Draconibacterium sp.]|nr:isochorismatase family protein [Draconibacterium sp.]
MKILLIPFVLGTFTLFAHSQEVKSTALIIVDIQDFYFPGGAAELVEPEKAAEKAKTLLQYFRENNGLVVHVKHNF